MGAELPPPEKPGLMSLRARQVENGWCTSRSNHRMEKHRLAHRRRTRAKPRTTRRRRARADGRLWPPRCARRVAWVTSERRGGARRPAPAKQPWRPVGDPRQREISEGNASLAGCGVRAARLTRSARTRKPAPQPPRRTSAAPWRSMQHACVLRRSGSGKGRVAPRRPGGFRGRRATPAERRSRPATRRTSCRMVHTVKACR